MSRSASIEFRPWRAGDEAAILALFQASFGRELSPAIWKWRFQDAPAGAGVIVLGWDGPELAAHYAVTSVNLGFAGRREASGLSGTTMTHPSYRGGGLFPRLAEATYQQMTAAHKAMVWGFPNRLSHRGFVEDLGWKDIYEIPTFRARLPLRRPVAAPPTVTEVAGPDESFDDLWRNQSPAYAIIGQRDAAALRWRYGQTLSGVYRFLVTRSEERLDGYAVVKRYKEELHIVDLLARDGETELRLVHGAIALAQRESITSVSLWLGTHRPLHLELERLGFENQEPVTYFGARVLDPSLDAAVVEDYKSWYLSMGDSDVY